VLSLADLREHFHEPLAVAAESMGVCTTFLKKRCREVGVRRWPFRDIDSLSKGILKAREGSDKHRALEAKLEHLRTYGNRLPQARHTRVASRTGYSFPLWWKVSSAEDHDLLWLEHWATLNLAAHWRRSRHPRAEHPYTRTIGSPDKH
jgi:hypothetical protein